MAKHLNINRIDKEKFIEHLGMIITIPELCEKFDITVDQYQRLLKLWSVCRPKHVAPQLRKLTYQIKYGVDHQMKLQEVKDKIKKTNLERHGCEYVMQNEEIKNKSRNTNLVRYNTPYTLANKEIRLKGTNKCLERYGVDHYAKSNEWLDICRTRHYDNFERFSEFVIPMFTKDEFVSIKIEPEKEYQWKCCKCDNPFKQRYYQTGAIIKNNCIPRCPICYPANNISLFEKYVVEYCRLILPENTEVIENSRKIIPPFELDIVIPSLKIAIECNGFYWHSVQANTDKNYHLNKTKECLKQGYRLIHIFENEWLSKRQIIESKLKSILGIKDKTIYARKCEIRDINSAVKNEFLTENHIQGADSSSIKYGLFYEDELVAVMTFGKPRFSKQYNYELIRYATKYHVIGGAGKLLKQFERSYPTCSIVTYADRRFSIGNMYEKLGFKFSHFSEPNYRYTKGQGFLTRYDCQKHKLEDLLGKDNFDIKLSETQNMINNGFYQIYDCGNIVYTKEK